MSLVARLWAFSRLLLCFWKCGCHAWLQYSKWGLTSVLISTLSEWQFNFLKHFLIKAASLFFQQYASQNLVCDQLVHPSLFHI